MIPKKIHYCWFGMGIKPPEFDRYLAGWRRLLPDYEIKEWNEENFDIDCCDYVREAYAMRSFAHVSDVCRVYALYHEGGVYLDTDVELLKPFGPLLGDGSFVGREDSHLLGTAVIGAEPEEEWIGKFLEYYKRRHFINAWGHPVRTPNTKILTETILPEMDEALWPKIYPANYFCGINWENHQPIVDCETVSVHHFAASWKRKRTMVTRIKTILKGLKTRYLK